MARRKIRKNAFVKVRDESPWRGSNQFTKFLGTVIQVQERKENQLLIKGTNLWIPVMYIEKIVTKEENPEYWL